MVAASTHPGEERIVIEACRALSPGSDPEIVLVPRHPRRARAVRRTAASLWPAGRVEVVDRMGALSAIYAQADIAVIGGTFVGVGGHDLFEPARAGCAIVVGPCFDRVRETAQGMQSAGALRMTTARDLAATIEELLRDGSKRDRLAGNARAFAAARGGTAAACATRIEELAASRFRPQS